VYTNIAMVSVKNGEIMDRLMSRRRCDLARELGGILLLYNVVQRRSVCNKMMVIVNTNIDYKKKLQIIKNSINNHYIDACIRHTYNELNISFIEEAYQFSVTI
jgi:hypothetical protein